MTARNITINDYGIDLRCFSCGGEDCLVIVNDDEDECVTALSDVRCGACWVRLLERRGDEGDTDV